MRNRPTALAILALLGIAITAFVLLVDTREPEHQGRPLSYWLYLYAAADYGWPHPEGAQAWTRKDEAAQAIRAIGPAAVPHLVRWIGYEPSATKTQLIMVMAKWRAGWANGWIPESFTIDRRRRNVVLASNGFQLLGPVASPAAPQLLYFASRSHDPGSAQRIVQALSALGTDGVLALSIILTNSNPVMPSRGFALFELSKLETNSLPAIPAIIQCLSDPDESIATMSATTLRCLRLRLDIAIPALAHALKDPRVALRTRVLESLGGLADLARPTTNAITPLLTNEIPELRDAATNALLDIAPEALTNTPAQ